jgi:hypothetical protein
MTDEYKTSHLPVDQIDKLETLTKEKSDLVRDIKWMRGEKT